MTFTSRLSLLIALLVGTLAAFLVREVVQTAAVHANVPTSTIVVARKPIAFGAPLTADNLEEVPWNSASPLEGGFAKVSSLVDNGRRLALLSMQPNEPVLASRVTAPNQRATLSTQLDDGMRAVTVRVDDVRGVAGFILPGDRVDVITTRGGEGAQDASAYADMLMQDVKVLAVDQLADERQDKPTIARAVTLELTVNQAQKIVLAEQIGRLSLVLRQANESADQVAQRVTVDDLGGNAGAARDKIAELEKSLKDAKAAAAAERQQSEKMMAQKMSELEARLRAAPPAPFGAAALKAPAPVVKTSPVVNVIRNGTKTEIYTVSAER